MWYLLSRVMLSYCFVLAISLSHDVENVQFYHPQYARSRPTPHSSDFRQGFGNHFRDFAHGLAVSCMPCRLPPIQSHERLRADGIQPGSLEWVILLQWLGSEKETSCFAFSCLYQPSLFITGFAPCSLALRCLYLLVNLNLESHSLRRKAAHFGGLT